MEPSFEAKRNLWCAKVAPVLKTNDSGCMEWPKACVFKDRPSYGVLSSLSVQDGKMQLVHRLSLEVHLGRELGKKELALHRCDNKRCANPDHLYVGNHSQNIQDAWDRGIRKKIRPNAKLTEKDVVAARILHQLFGKKCRELSDLYGISYNGMEAILSYRNWKAVA